jgi:predicted SprT family Zn-dependent metalloprotease
MHKFNGSKRLTHKFNDAWKSEDQWEDVGVFRLLKSRRVQERDEGYTLLQTIVAPRGVSREDVEQVLRDEFRWSCRCQHDCCGHRFGYVTRVQRVKRRNWVAEVCVGYNV